MSMEDARLDHLTLRLDSLHDRLLQRAQELSDGRAMAAELRKQIRVRGGAPSAEGIAAAIARVLADELRGIAGSLE